MHVIFDRLARCLGRSCEQRANVDVEAEIRKSRSDDLLSTVVAVLTDFSNQQAGATAFRRFESFDGSAHTFDGAGHADLPLVNTCNRLDLSSMAAKHLFQRR